MQEKYFVSYIVYAGFGDISESRETFTTWISMRKFANNLRQGALLDYGEIPSQATSRPVAA